MKNKQDIYNRLTFKLCINALSICFISLMVLPIHAEEKTAAAAAAAAVSGVSRAPNNKSNNPEVVAEDMSADIKAASVVAAAMATLGLPDNVINKPEVIVEEIPADVKAAVEKELSSRIKITKSETNESASLVFRAPIYKVNQFLGYIAVVDGEVLELSKPNTNEKLPGYLKLIRDNFVLDSQEQAEILESAIQPIIPYKLPKIVKPVKIDHGWIIFRDDFFKNYSGLVFTTDEKGKITFVEYIMKINPKDFSYEKQEY